MSKITSFSGKYAFLSNFYFCKSMQDKTSEHYYQAAKAENNHDAEIILSSEDPGKTKRMGRKIQIRSDWESIKDKTMYDILVLKFLDPDLRKRLLETGDAELVEGNYWHDNYWGKCSCQKCSTIEGKNMLGKTLMRIRKEIQDGII